MTADPIVLQLKYAAVVRALSKHGDMDLRTALDRFYRSETYQEMRTGLSDMHCRSPKYLASDILMDPMSGMCARSV
jgi:hypothetical protein